MTNAQKYDLMAAVRGPDIRDNSTFDSLKKELTARVRVILFKKKKDIKGISNSTPLTDGDIENIARWIKKIERNKMAFHYLTHMRDAVAASGTHKVWGKKAGKLIALLLRIHTT